MGKKKRSSSGKKQDDKTDQGKSWLIMNQVKPPEPFNFQESASWSTWIKRYKLFHSAVGLSSAGEEQQINMLLYCMGQEAEELLNSLGMTEEKRTSFNSVVSTFEDYFTMKKNAFYYRSLFMERNQRPGEKFDCYINGLRELSEKCEWSCKNCKCKDFKDEMILIKLITGIDDKNLSKRLLRQDVRTLTECVKVLRESEAGEKDDDGDALQEFTTLGIERKNTSPGPQVVPPPLKRGSRSSVSEDNSDTKTASFTTATQHRECALPGSSLPKSTLREEKGNMRSSFSSGVDTGDEYSMDELSYNSYFYITGENPDGFYDVEAKRNASSGTTTKLCEAQRLKSCGCRVVNCSHVTRVRESESASTTNRKLSTGSLWSEISKPASIQYRPRIVKSPNYGFDSDEDDEYSENLYDFHQKNYTANKTCSSMQTTFKLDDSWPELERRTPNVDDKPKTFENNYYFSVSGHTSRKSLRKMCQQQLKSSY